MHHQFICDAYKILEGPPTATRREPMSKKQPNLETIPQASLIQDHDRSWGEPSQGKEKEKATIEGILGVDEHQAMEL